MLILLGNLALLLAAVDNNSVEYKASGIVACVAFAGWFMWKLYRSPIYRTLALIGAGLLLMSAVLIAMLMLAKNVQPPGFVKPTTVAPR